MLDGAWKDTLATAIAADDAVGMLRSSLLLWQEAEEKRRSTIPLGVLRERGIEEALAAADLNSPQEALLLKLLLSWVVAENGDPESAARIVRRILDENIASIPYEIVSDHRNWKSQYAVVILCGLLPFLSFETARQLAFCLLDGYGLEELYERLAYFGSADLAFRLVGSIESKDRARVKIIAGQARRDDVDLAIANISLIEKKDDLLNWEHLYEIGLSCLRRGRSWEARTYLLQSLDACNEFPIGFVRAAHFRKVIECSQDFETLRGIVPHLNEMFDAKVLYLLAQKCMSFGDSGISLAEQVISWIDRDRIMAIRGLLNLLERCRHNKVSVAHRKELLDKVVASFSLLNITERFEGRSLLAVAYSMVDDHDSAAAAIASARAHLHSDWDPEPWQSLLHIGIAEMKCGFREEAKKTIEEVVKMAMGQTDSLWFVKAIVWHLCRDDEIGSAMAVFQTTRRKFAQDQRDEVRTIICLGLVDSNRPERAVSCARKIIQPRERASTMLSLAKSLQGRGMVTVARIAFSASLEAELLLEALESYREIMDEECPGVLIDKAFHEMGGTGTYLRVADCYLSVEERSGARAALERGILRESRQPLIKEEWHRAIFESFLHANDTGRCIELIKQIEAYECNITRNYGPYTREEWSTSLFKLLESFPQSRKTILDSLNEYADEHRKSVASCEFNDQMRSLTGNPVIISGKPTGQALSFAAKGDYARAFEIAGELKKKDKIEVYCAAAIHCAENSDLATALEVLKSAPPELYPNAVVRFAKSPSIQNRYNAEKILSLIDPVAGKLSGSQALAELYLLLDKPEKALEIAKNKSTFNDGSEQSVILQVAQHFQDSGRRQEARSVAEQLKPKIRLSFLLRCAQAGPMPEKSQLESLSELLDHFLSENPGLRDIEDDWIAPLVTFGLGEKLISYIRASATESEFGRTWRLGTLAALFARQGQYQEALDVLSYVRADHHVFWDRILDFIAVSHDRPALKFFLPHLHGNCKTVIKLAEIMPGMYSDRSAELAELLEEFVGRL